MTFKKEEIIEISGLWLEGYERKLVNDIEFVKYTMVSERNKMGSEKSKKKNIDTVIVEYDSKPKSNPWGSNKSDKLLRATLTINDVVFEMNLTPYPDDDLMKFEGIITNKKGYYVCHVKIGSKYQNSGKVIMTRNIEHYNTSYEFETLNAV